MKDHHSDRERIMFGQNLDTIRPHTNQHGQKGMFRRSCGMGRMRLGETRVGHASGRGNTMKLISEREEGCRGAS